MEKLYRFELSFDGIPQNVGFLQGLDDVGLQTRTLSKLTRAFDTLPVVTLQPPCEFWFTEQGMKRFTADIGAVIRAIKSRGWGLQLGIMEAKEAVLKRSLYRDKWQAAWVPCYLAPFRPEFIPVNGLRDIRREIKRTQQK